MWRPLLALLLLVPACGADVGRACTMIGAPTGVNVEVALATAETGTIEVCWDGRCVQPRLDLLPASRAGDTTCTGTAPEDTCGASAVPTGGKTGFAAIEDLPAKQVTVRLRLADAAGAPVVDRELTPTARTVYPNGPDCGGAGPQLSLAVGADGSVAQR
ncbi:hypothetical protein ABZ816_38560 [Actinosynnema sp. NPDC047251]|uniref:Putative secreted protein n=1 Tax=Saccharothrix espanaensis (strain ATCC 51144 / DSM 44229 / JCM 9112 / NBRC 15066 / NRRL 15764) TaxID=1179773 RepID=K0JUK7_SACES|nr:putative secreted protein [Saccharothrix espanaensis DSM 44229]